MDSFCSRAILKILITPEILNRRKKVISLLVKLGGEKLGFGPLFWFDLDWNLDFFFFFFEGVPYWVEEEMLVHLHTNWIQNLPMRQAGF